MPRQARLDAPGTLHHVMIRGIERREIVDNDTDRKDFVSRMGKIASETQTSIYAWSLMVNMRIFFCAVVHPDYPDLCGGFLPVMLLIITSGIAATVICFRTGTNPSSVKKILIL